MRKINSINIKKDSRLIINRLHVVECSDFFLQVKIVNTYISYINVLTKCKIYLREHVVCIVMYSGLIIIITSCNVGNLFYVI